MREAARRAAGAGPNNRPNALFIAAAAEDLTEFAGSADEAMILFPWSSLLGGVVGQVPEVLASIAFTLKPAATMTVLFSLVERDGVARPGEADLRLAYRAASLDLESFDTLAAADLASIRSSWARRLGVGKRRPGWRLVARKTDAVRTGATADPG